MHGSIRLSEQQRKVSLQEYRFGASARLARQAHIVLLCAHGWSYRDIRRVAYVSYDLIVECVRRFRQGGVYELLDRQPPDVPSRPVWAQQVVRWLVDHTPSNFGYFRQRWTCATLAEVLAWEKNVRVSDETMRRWLHQAGLVWRRPRPVVGPTDPLYAWKLEKIQGLLAYLPTDETAVVQDESTFI